MFRILCFFPSVVSLRLVANSGLGHLGEPVVSQGDAQKGVVDIGDCARFRKFKAKLSPGHTIKLTGIGGSASAGFGLTNLDDQYLNQVGSLLKLRFGVNVKTQMVAIGSTGSDYWAHCAGAHLSQDVDAIFGEFAINDVSGWGGSTYQYTPHEDRVLETVLSNAARVGHGPLFVSANFVVPVMYGRKMGLNVSGYRDMYKKHGVPVLDVARLYSSDQMETSGMCSNNHPSAKQHRVLAELFLGWIEKSEQSCPWFSQDEVSLGAASRIEKDQRMPQEWAAGKNPTHPAMEGPLNCKTTLAPRAEGSFLYPLGAGEGVAMEAAPTVEGIETGVPPGVHAVPGWELKALSHGMETNTAVRQDLKLRWVPSEVGVPLRLPADVDSLGAIGLIYFADKQYGDFDVTLFRDGEKTTRPVHRLNGNSNGRHTRTDVLWTGLEPGKYEVQVAVSALPGIGVVGLSSA